MSAPQPSLPPRPHPRLARIALAFLLFLCLADTALALPQPARTTIPALFLSDIHLDPFADPGKVPQLAMAPTTEWLNLFAAPSSPTQVKDLEALQEACHVRGVDTSAQLWQASLTAMKQSAPAPRFITVSGDLLAHDFDCKFKQTFPAARESDYLAFVTKTIQFISQTLQAAYPGTPVYTAMGNNDSACGDYRDDRNSPFLAAVAPIVAQSLAAAPSAIDRPAILRDFAAGGFFSAPLPIENTHILVLDDLFLSDRFRTCAGKPDPAAPEAQIGWLRTHLADARRHHRRIWLLAHIPPGVDLYATLRKLGNVCAQARPQMFLVNEQLADLLAQYPDVVRLAIFGHSHADELRLLTRQPSQTGKSGIPVKIVPSISPINGNFPAFTIAEIDPRTASLADYTVIAASDLAGIGPWTREYTFSETYHQPAFNATALESLTTVFTNDQPAHTPESNAYLQHVYVGDRAALLKPLWPEYTCALAHDSEKAYTACVCAK